MAKDIGKWFEGKLRSALVQLQADHGLFFHRIKDSHSAGRIVGNAPADFLVAIASQAQLWEAKASEIHPSLRSCLSSMVDNDQVGWHKLWNMNGCASYFIFYSDLIDMVEVWKGQDVCKARVEGVPLEKNGYLFTTTLGQLNPRLLELFKLRRHYDKGTLDTC